MARIVVFGSASTSLQVAEQLVKAGKSVDLFTNAPAPFGLIKNCTASGDLRLFGNVKVGIDVTLDELVHSTDVEALLRSRKIAFTSWSGGCAHNPVDWAIVVERAKRIPVCF